MILKRYLNTTIDNSFGTFHRFLLQYSFLKNGWVALFILVYSHPFSFDILLRCELFAIGNGTGCRETETYLTRLIAQKCFDPYNVQYTIINETGASQYSVSPEARTEFPGLDPNHISARMLWFILLFLFLSPYILSFSFITLFLSVLFCHLPYCL